jgi:probable HAF family extracellular repeat protein
MRKRILLILVMMTAILCSNAVLQASDYYFRDLGVMDGISSMAWGINNNRQVVGWVNYAAGGPLDSQAFLWTLSGGMQPLGTLGGRYSWAYKISDNGTIVGESQTGALPGFPNGIGTGFYKPLSQAMQQMPHLIPIPNPPPPWPYSRAYGVNDSGQVAGFSNNLDAAMQAVIWPNFTSTPTALGTFGGDHGVAFDINASGAVVGQAEVTPGSTDAHAFYWPGSGDIQDLGTLRADGAGISTARGLNDMGDIVGGATNEDNLREAFIKLSGGNMTGLGGLGGSVDGLMSLAQDVNANDEVVGYAYTPEGVMHAFLYTEDGGLQDLNDLIINLPAGVTLARALGINDSGEIVGYTTDTRAFLLSYDPSIVPLPGTVLLLGSGFLGLIGLRGFRKS